MANLKSQAYAAIKRSIYVKHFLCAVSAFFSILAVGYISRGIVGIESGGFIVASMGAAVVLLFVQPRSRMSRPWALVGGHFVSAFVGVTCSQGIADPTLAAAMAVALALMSMSLLRCIHPPGGAVALAAVIGGPQIAALGYWFVIYPVMFNALILLLLAVLLNRILLGNNYPLQDHRSEND